MARKVSKSWKEETKIFDSLTKCRVKCKCGHSVILTNVDRAICSWCGHYVYKTPQIEFKYKLKERGIKCG